MPLSGDQSNETVTPNFLRIAHRLLPVSAADKDQRFVELPGPSGKTNTYDLSTVQMIQPGRFTIISTSIDDADVMKLGLKVLDTLRTYCNDPDWKYPAPTDLFTLGPPDMPIRSIEVTSSQTQLAGRNYPFKMVSWPYPYTRLATQIQGRAIASPRLSAL